MNDTRGANKFRDCRGARMTGRGVSVGSCTPHNQDKSPAHARGVVHGHGTAPSRVRLSSPHNQDYGIETRIVEIIDPGYKRGPLAYETQLRQKAKRIIEAVHAAQSSVPGSSQDA